MSAESKSEASDRLRPSTSEGSPSSTTPMSAATSNTSSQNTQLPATTTNAGQQDEPQKSNKTSYSVNKQQTAALYQHYLNTFNSSLSKEELRSQRTRSSIVNTQSQQQTFREFQNHPVNHAIANQRTSGNLQHHPSSRLLNPNMAHIYRNPLNIPPSLNQHHYASPYLSNSGNLSRSVPREETMISYKSYAQQQPPHSNQRAYSTGTSPLNSQQSHLKQKQSKDGLAKVSTHNFRHDQLELDSEETTTIKEELENDLEGCENSELEAISSLERNLPIELSFLIRQQAYCFARTNYLERQLKELKEVVSQQQQQVDMNRVPAAPIQSRNHLSRPVNNNPTAAMTHTKNGNFILSDDSGGEYSRATLSDDDELSSLLDQIVKTVRPAQSVMNDNILINSDSQMHHLQQQQQQQQQYQQRLSTAYNPMISNQQQQQPYAIINSNQLHHQQAVPIFVMSSPIAVAHPSSINSNILPGVHFQPEPRYNQYYEDLYAVTNTQPSTIAAPSASIMQRQNLNPNAYRSQHFDNSISAIEQLVSQKEKRQIIAQMKSADNWLKMRANNSSASLFNQQGSSMKNVGDEQTAMTTSDETQGQGDAASIR